MTALNYSPKVLDHFRNPHNFGSIENADTVGEVGNMTCGDVMKLYLKIDKNEAGDEYIQDVKFETLGCAAAIATSSVVTDLCKGKTLTEALKINNADVIKALDNLPIVKIHCSLLAADALAEAIFAYYQKTGQDIPSSLEQTHKRIGVCRLK